MVLQDGQSYENFDEVLDIVSCFFFKFLVGNVREYVGLSTDIAKLPKYKNSIHGEAIGGGSTALCTDTSDVYIYNPSDDSWKKL